MLFTSRFCKWWVRSFEYTSSSPRHQHLDWARVDHNRRERPFSWLAYWRRYLPIYLYFVDLQLPSPCYEVRNLFYLNGKNIKCENKSWFLGQGWIWSWLRVIFLTSTFSPIEAICILVPPHFYGVPFRKWQFFIAGIWVWRHGGRIVIEQREKPPSSFLRIGRIIRVVLLIDLLSSRTTLLHLLSSHLHLPWILLSCKNHEWEPESMFGWDILETPAEQQLLSNCVPSIF